MPLGRYTLIHREPRSTTAERDTLIDALMQMAGGDRRPRHGDGGSDDNSGRRRRLTGVTGAHRPTGVTV